MTATLKPHYFTTASYDSQSGNLVLTSDDAQPFTAGPLDQAGVLALLGEKLGNRLLSTPAPAESGWGFQIEGEWQLWPLKVESLTSHLQDDDGNDSGYVAYAYNPPAGNQVFLDIQARDAAQGEVTMALTVTTNEKGAPSVVVHDRDGTWAGTLEVSPSGQVQFLSGNYSENAEGLPAPSAVASPVKVVVAAYADDDKARGPMYASFDVDSTFMERLFHLRALCQTHGLTEVRVYAWPAWQEGASTCVLPELVVSAHGSMYFEDRPKHASYTIQTRGLDIEELARLASEVAMNEVIYCTDDQTVIDTYKKEQGIDAP